MKKHMLLAVLCALLPSLNGYAQSVNPSPTSPQIAEEDVVTLSVFEVSSNHPARYQAAEAVAGGRISTSIMDSPTTVTVLTSEFMQDVGGSRVLDAAKYVAGVGEARIPSAQERATVRGFEINGRLVDGFRTFDQSNYDHGGIDRVEIVKGPDALLHPTGTPGGTINLVTKKPQFTPGGHVKVQVGEYSTNRAEVDVTGPINSSFAYRAIVAAQDSKGYVRDHERRSLLFTPSLAWRLGSDTNLTLRYEYYDFSATNDVGVPTDPSVGTNTGFKTWEGVSRRMNPTFGRKSEYRETLNHDFMGVFTSTVTDRLSVRLAARYTHVNAPDSDLRIRTSYATPPPTPDWTNINPLTGEWDPNFIYDPNPPYAPIPTPGVSPIVGLTGGRVESIRRNRDVQNDWSYIVETDAVKSTTLLGFSYSYDHVWSNRHLRSATPIDLTVQPKPTGSITAQPINQMRRSQQSRYQVYLTEQLSLLNGRLLLSGGVAHLTFNGSSGDLLSAAKPPPNPTVAGQMFPGSGSQETFNYGIVFKPIQGVSVYYGHTENAVPVGDFEQVGLGNAPTFSSGEQDEFGIKGNFLDGRIIASVAYYEITQSGYAVFNPGNFSNPPPPILLPAIYISRVGKGWEYQLTGSITPSFSVIASYADTTNRDPNGNLLAGAAEEMANAYLRYEFLGGPAKGLALALGINWMSERAIENVSGYTPASTPGNLIPIKSSGFLPSRYLVDATVSYSRDKWSYSLTVVNALDKEYIAAADSRNLIVPGAPLNVYGSVTWKF